MSAPDPRHVPTRGLVYRDLAARLREAGIETAALDARLLLGAATGIDDVALIADPDVPVDEADLAKLATLTERRVAGTPVSRLLGVREFWGLDFTLNAATLDPRPDSETLVDAVLAQVDDRSAHLRVLDLGTGTGCLLLALLSELPNAHGMGVDCVSEAIQAATNNAAQLGVAERVQFCLGNWGADLEGPFDIIVSNPPYIPTGDLEGLSREVREHDPLAALDGGKDGLVAYRDIAPDMARLLAPGGFGFWEFGVGQSADVVDIAQQAGLQVQKIEPDLSGIPRVLIMKC